MLRKSVTWLLAAGLLASLGAGCASSDIDQLRSQIADVRKIAMEAQNTANAASAAADGAQTAAEQAKTMSRVNSDKLTRMMKK